MFYAAAARSLVESNKAYRAAVTRTVTMELISSDPRDVEAARWDEMDAYLEVTRGRFILTNVEIVLEEQAELEPHEADDAEQIQEFFPGGAVDALEWDDIEF